MYLSKKAVKVRQQEVQNACKTQVQMVDVRSHNNRRAAGWRAPLRAGSIVLLVLALCPLRSKCCSLRSLGRAPSLPPGR